MKSFKVKLMEVSATLVLSILLSPVAYFITIYLSLSHPSSFFAEAFAITYLCLALSLPIYIFNKRIKKLSVALSYTLILILVSASITEYLDNSKAAFDEKPFTTCYTHQCTPLSTPSNPSPSIPSKNPKEARLPPQSIVPHLPIHSPHLSQSTQPFFSNTLP